MLRRQHRHINSTDTRSNMALSLQQRANNISIRQEHILIRRLLLPYHPAHTSIQHSLTRNTHSKRRQPTRSTHSKYHRLRITLHGRPSTHSNNISNSRNIMRHHNTNNINTLSPHLSLPPLQVSNSLRSSHFRLT
jgi:hypothetical protein